MDTKGKKGWDGVRGTGDGWEASAKTLQCCDMRLVQIRKLAAPSELGPKCLYRKPPTKDGSKPSFFQT
jgi:hypothetical protein